MLKQLENELDDKASPQNNNKPFTFCLKDYMKGTDKTLDDYLTNL